MLIASSLSKQYTGNRAVDATKGVTFEIAQGSFIAIVGRSGSGKSTLLGMLGGISRPTDGIVTIDGINQWQLNDDRHADFRNEKIGFVFQFSSLLPTLRAIDNVALPALVSGGLTEGQAYTRARALLDRVGLAERADAYPSELSGGEQRRAAIARALINSPGLLLADEPTADLDAETEEGILNLLIDIHQAFELTLVVITHNPNIASRADRVLEMSAGKLVSVSSNENRTDTIVTEQTVQSLERLFQEHEEPEERIKLGEGIERFVGRLVLWLIPMCCLVWAMNFGIATYEQSVIDAKAAERSALEELGLQGLRVDVKDVTFAPNNTYNVKLYFRNTTPDNKPMFVMSPTVRAFVQVGSSWLEVALKPAKSSPNVIEVSGTHFYDYVLDPQVKDFIQLIPYYMHVRISNDMLISPNSEGKGELLERNDNYYVYIKPHNADDKAILSKLNFPGQPPVWIPMPPH